MSWFKIPVSKGFDSYLPHRTLLISANDVLPEVRVSNSGVLWEFILGQFL